MYPESVKVSMMQRLHTKSGTSSNQEHAEYHRQAYNAPIFRCQRAASPSLRTLLPDDC